MQDELKKSVNIGTVLPDNLMEIKKKIDENPDMKNVYKEENILIESTKYLVEYYSKEYSIISKLFLGLHTNIIECLECKSESITYEPYLVLSLPIEEESILEKCIKNFSMEEKLTDKNQYDCKTCKKKNDAIKHTKISRFPNILIVHLKRFTNTGRGVRKNNTKISIPLNLELDTTYNLYAITQHGGSLEGGHYVSCTRNPWDDKWYYYSDTTVLRLNDDIEKELNKSENYLMFYTKKSLDISK
jgi:ubiquitin carboxyl-terminal hydrolase 8